jgi:hypothetical protein
MRISCHIVAFVLLAAPAAHGQTASPLQGPAPAAPLRDASARAAPDGSGVIRGRVTDAATGRPLRNVFIRLNVRNTPTGLSDSDGQYEIAHLSPGKYELTAFKETFITLKYGQRAPYGPARPIDVREGETAIADLALQKGGVLAGQVIDGDGQPVPRATVAVFRRHFVNGRPELAADVARSDMTDDTGAFRVYGVPPGAYFLLATAGNELVNIPQMSTGVGTYYVATRFPEQAQVVRVEPAQEVAGLVITNEPYRTATITGSIRTPDGVPASYVTIQTWSASGFFGYGQKQMIRRDDGTFVVSGLVPGEYWLIAQTPGGAASPTAVVRVPVDGTDVEVLLVLRKGATLRGRIVFDDEGEVPSAAGIGLRMRREAPMPAFGYFVSQSVDSNWNFEMTPFIGSQLVRPILPDEWTLKSVELGRTDITDTPIDFDGSDVGPVIVHVTRRQTVLSGLVVDAAHRPVDDATVVIFADNAQKWGPDSRYVVAARSDQSGRFTHRGLPAGSYLAVAVPALEVGEETNPETLARLRSRGVPITVGDGEARAVELTISMEP